MSSNNPFKQRKCHILDILSGSSASSSLSACSDNSPKGSVDEAALPIINSLNSFPTAITTSSCSGRIVLFADFFGGIIKNISKIKAATKSTEMGKESTNFEIKKKLVEGNYLNDCWCFVSHDSVQIPDGPGELYSALMPGALPFDESQSGTAFLSSSLENLADKEALIYLKFEPFILHVEVEDVPTARKLLHLFVSNGFRNSGISLSLSESSKSSSERIIVAARCTLKLDVPVAIRKFTNSRSLDTWIVSEDYLRMLVKIANQKFTANLLLIHKLEENLKNIKF